MKIIESPKYKCNKCHKIYTTDIEDFSSPEVNSESRNMGEEIQYIWNYESECEKCSNNIEIIIEGYEYPQGFLNYEDTTSSGCIITKKAKLES